jgi:hypothetical protein
MLTNIEIGYDLYEVTSSGLTHYFRVGFLVDHILPNDYKVSQTHGTFNFAYITFDWGNTRYESKANISIKDIDNNDLIHLTLSHNDLVYNKTDIANPNCSTILNRRYKTWKEYFKYYSQHPVELYVLPVYMVMIFLITLFLMLPFFILRAIYRCCRRPSVQHLKQE